MSRLPSDDDGSATGRLSQVVDEVLRGSQLVGRRTDLIAVCARAQAGRIVTITGPGGVGKTALAHLVADALAPENDDVWRCDAVAVSDSDELASTIADTLGTFRNEEDTTVEAVLGVLRHRRALLLVDNVEQVAAPAAELLARIVAECPGVTVLATSRVSLGVAAEEQWVLAPLDPTSDGVQLFRRLAASIDGAIELPDDDVAAVCVALDGLPLALELAAAQLGDLSIGDIRARLDQRFRVLRDTARPDRQATLVATVRWSYDLLPATGRHLFDRLSVFPGGFDAAGARAVFGAEAANHDVGALLDDLVASSMLSRTSERGRTRYRLLETLRQFGDRQLAERGERASVRNAHLDHMIDVASAASARCHDADWSKGVADFQADWENLRAAVHWAVDTQRNTDVDRLLRDVFFMARWSLEAEPAIWAQRAIERAAVTGGRVGAPAHLHRAFAAFLGGRHDGALEENQAALTLRATPSDRSWARLYAAIELLYLGRTDEAASMAEVMVADTPPRAVEQAMQGSAHPVFKMYARQMDFEDAMDRVFRAEAVAEATANPVARGHVAYNRGLLLYARGDVEAARVAFRLVLELGREHDVANLIGYVLTSQVSAPGRSGLLAAVDALSYWRERRDVGNEFVVLEGAGINLAELGRLEPAGVILGHLDQSGRRMASSRARRESAAAEIGLHRRSERWAARGREMSRAELIAYAEEAVSMTLASL